MLGWASFAHASRSTAAVDLRQAQQQRKIHGATFQPFICWMEIACRVRNTSFPA
jgi:hypothetical protein